MGSDIANAMTGSNVDEAELAKFERLASDWWDEDGPLATLHAINPLRLDYIDAHAMLDGARVLDVGCGGGILSEGLALRGAEVVGLDLARDSIRVAAEHAAGRGLSIDYRCDSVEQLASAESGSFDIVTCLEVLEHVPAPELTVAACALAAKPGGAVFFSTINRNPKSFALAILGAEYLLGMLPRGTHDYLKLLKPSELGATARACGLDVRNLSGMHFNPLTQRYSLGGNVDVNYFAFCRKAALN